MLCWRQSQLRIRYILIYALIAVISAASSPARAEVYREDNSKLAGKLNFPLYIWKNPEDKPRCLIIAIHGTMMHGAIFDDMANQLAESGALVVAPDLCGFGRWCKEPGRWKGKCKINFAASMEGLEHLLKNLDSTYPDLPVICLGESLGANLAVKLASKDPDLVDGLILSNPCIRPRMFAWSLLPKLSLDAITLVFVPWRQLSLKPQARLFLKKEPVALEDYLNDPMARKSLSMMEFFNAVRTLKSTTKVVPNLPAGLPILVIRGTNDCVCIDKPVNRFVDSLNSQAMRIYWIQDGGHVLLQTSAYKPVIGEEILKWIEQSVKEPATR